MRTAVVIVIFLALAGYAAIEMSAGKPDKPNYSAAQLDPKGTAIKNVDFKFDWGKASDGMVMLANFTFKNNNDFAVKDLTVTCNHHANSGTVIDSNTRTIYEMIKPKATKAVRNFNMGFINSQAASSGCHIADLVAMN